MNNSLSLTKNKKMAEVNLDALIKREDLFKINDDEPTISVDTSDTKALKIESNLKQDGYFFKTLKKADFQRVTSEWKPERVAGLIKSFINGDIIPAIILWHLYTSWDKDKIRNFLSAKFYLCLN